MSASLEPAPVTAVASATDQPWRGTEGDPIESGGKEVIAPTCNLVIERDVVQDAPSDEGSAAGDSGCRRAAANHVIPHVIVESLGRCSPMSISSPSRPVAAASADVASVAAEEAFVTRSASPASAVVNHHATADTGDDYLNGTSALALSGVNDRLRRRYRLRDSVAPRGVSSAAEVSYDGDALVDLIDNPEYIDTLEGRLPLAAAAKMIARESVAAAVGSGLVTPEARRREANTKLMSLACATMLFTSAFFACYNVQTADSSTSSVGRQLRTEAALALGSTAWLGSLFASPLMHAVGSPRPIIVTAAFVPLLYAAAGFAPPFLGGGSPATVLPVSIAQGLAVGMLVAVEGAHWVRITETYVTSVKEPWNEVYRSFSGLSTAIALGGRTVGGIVALVAMDRRDVVRDGSTPRLLYGNRTAENACGPLYNWSDADLNQTLASSSVIVSIGSNGSSGGSESYLHRGQLTERCVLFGVLLLFVLAGAHSARASLCSGGSGVRSRGRSEAAYLTPARTTCHSIRSFLASLLDIRLLLLLPNAVALGLGDAVVSGNFTEAFMACRMGAVGAVRSLLLDSVAAVLGAGLYAVAFTRWTNQALVACLGTVFSFSSLMLLQFWQPWMFESVALMLATSAAWSFGEGLLIAMLNGVLGNAFKEWLPPACTVMLMFYGGSYACGSLMMSQLWGSLAIKLYAVMGSIAAGLSGIVVLEVLMRRGVV